MFNPWTIGIYDMDKIITCKSNHRGSHVWTERGASEGDNCIIKNFPTLELKRISDRERWKSHRNFVLSKIQQNHNTLYHHIRRLESG